MTLLSAGELALLRSLADKPSNSTVEDVACRAAIEIEALRAALKACEPVVKECARMAQYESAACDRQRYDPAIRLILIATGRV